MNARWAWVMIAWRCNTWRSKWLAIRVVFARRARVEAVSASFVRLARLMMEYK